MIRASPYAPCKTSRRLWAVPTGRPPASISKIFGSAAGAEAAVRDRPRAVSRGVAVDRVAGEPGQARHAAGRLERAPCRSRDAARRSHRPGGAGAPGAAAGAGARLPLLADLPDDALLLECAALSLGPLVWRPQDDDLTLGLGAGAGLVAAHLPMAWGASQGVDGLCG